MPPCTPRRQPPIAAATTALLIGMALALLPATSPAGEAAADIVQTATSLAVNRGTYTCSDDALSRMAAYTIAGTFYSNRYVSPKFPCGGALHLVGGEGAGTRLNPAAALIFDGGYLFVDTATAAMAEQVRAIEFRSGLSEIRLENGAQGCTTLSATAPGAGIVRRQGATAMVGGDLKRSKAGLTVASGVQPAFTAALGVAEKLVCAGNMAAFLKGAGGPAGATNRSVIPWMTVGSYLQPGMGGVATYDPATGVRGLAPGEYDKTITGAPDRNCWVESIELGENKQQTINALVFIPYFSCQIGKGSTLTITSGFLQFGQRGPSTIGSHPQGGDYLSTGTIDFGAAEGVIWTCFEPEWGPNIIGPVIAGSGGLTVTGTNTLILQGANTYTGKTCVSAGVLQVGDVFPSAARLGSGDLEVAAGATVRILNTVPRALAPTATVTLLRAGTSFYGVLDLQHGVAATVAGLVIDGARLPAGTYGGADSPAGRKLPSYFSGAGTLTVSGAP